MRERRTRLLPWIVILLGAIPWLPALDAAFVYDDTNVIRPARLEGRTLAETLTTRRPAVELSFDVNRAFGGFEPRGYHAVNVALHLLAALFVFGFVRRTLLCMAAPWPARADALAFASTLLWTVHPLQTESVTYVVQRAEVMAGLGVFAALWSLTRASVSPRSVAWQIAAVAACLFAMASKASAAAAPLMLLTWDVLFGARGLRAALRARPLLHVGSLASLLVLVAVGVVGGVLGVGGVRGTVGFTSSVGAIDYAASQPRVVLEYLRLVFWPHPLSIDRGWPVASGLAAALPSMIAILALIGMCVHGLRRRAPWAMAGALFFLALAPTSSFIPIDDLFYEHRMYVALLAPIALVVCLTSGLGPRTGAVVLVAVASLLGGHTWQRNLDYHDPVKLFRQTLETNPDNLRARLNLAVALREAGETEAAVTELRRIVESPGPPDPRRPHAAWHLARVHRECGEDALALASYGRALESLPDDVGLRFDLATTLLELDRGKDALAQLDEIVRRRPDHRGAALLRVHALLLIGDPGRASDAIEAVLARHPRWAAAYEFLGIVRRRQGRSGDAIAAYRKATGINPRRHKAWFNLSVAAAQSDDVALGLDAAKRAAEIAPENPRYAYQVAAFQRRSGRLADAHQWLLRAESLGIAKFGVPVEDELRELESLIQKGE